VGGRAKRNHDGKRATMTQGEHAGAQKSSPPVICVTVAPPRKCE
jgi:hypothetical protein